MTDARVLLVDDDENLLRGLERGLRKQFAIDTAVGPEAGLLALQRGVTYAVLVADMRMPGMDGVTFLGQAGRLAPDTVRMMLTGNTDLDTAIRAVNEGNVFRFLNKPCELEQFANMLTAGIRQHGLVTAEHQLLEKTLQGAIRVCTDILSAVDPNSQGQAARVRDLVRPVLARLGLADSWQIELAALLARIGTATIPPVVLVRQRHGHALTGVEHDMLARVPEIGSEMLRRVPRLEGVAEMVLQAEKNFDGSGWPRDGVAGARIPAGARLLKIVGDYVALTTTGETPLRAIELLRQQQGAYDPVMLV